MFQCQVIRTHHLGQRRAERDQSAPITGTVRMYAKHYPELNRYIEVMSLDSLAQFGATLRAPIPDLYEPRLLTFFSDRGMMVAGFEEIAGQRYYQGWWMQWKNLLSEVAHNEKTSGRPPSHDPAYPHPDR